MATTNLPNRAHFDVRTAAPHYTENWSPPVLSRVTGVLMLIWLALVFVPRNDQFFSDLSAQQIVTWASHNQKAIWIGGFMWGLQNTLMVVILVLLSYLAMERPILAGVARVAAAAAMAAGWMGAGTEYALADLAHRGGAEAGVLALFSLAKTATYTDGLSFEIAIGAISIMLLRSRMLPRAVSWLGLAYAVVLSVTFPVQLAITGTGNGPQGPLHAILTVLWALVLGITLLVKPARVTPTECDPITE